MTFESMLDELLAEIRELVISRHKKYGPDNISKTGRAGITVRLQDKLARVQRHVFQQTGDFTDETVLDTWRDIVGYGLIGIAWEKGYWNTRGCPLFESEIADKVESDPDPDDDDWPDQWWPAFG